MQERFGFVNEYYAWVASHHLRDNSRKCLHAITCLINYLSSCVEPDSICMYTSLLDIVAWSSLREPNPQLAQVSWVQNKVSSEGIENDSTYFMPFRIVSKEHLKAAFWGTLQITSPLLTHKTDATATVKHEGKVCQIPPAKGPNVHARRLHALRQRLELDLLPPVSTTHEDVANLLCFARIRRLTNSLNRLRRALWI